MLHIQNVIRPHIVQYGFSAIRMLKTKQQVLANLLLLLTSQNNTNKNVSVSMMSRSDKQKIQSLANKPLLSQLPGRYVFTVFYLNTSLHCIWRVLSRLLSAGQQLALKYNIYDDSGLYRL